MPLASQPLRHAGRAEAFPCSARNDSLQAPEATEKTREEKRFSRYDKNKDGKVQIDEYLAARRKNFDKLDLDHNGSAVVSRNMPPRRSTSSTAPGGARAS